MPQTQQQFEDVQLRCAGCGHMFTWTAGEQRFFAQKDFQEPKRCKPCREARKAGKKPD